jgi:hypothetical protein
MITCPKCNATFPDNCDSWECSVCQLKCSAATKFHWVSKSVIMPKPQTYWTHTSGDVYQVIMITNEHSTKPDYPVTVVYQDIQGQVWSRPMWDWHRAFMPQTRPISRTCSGSNIHKLVVSPSEVKIKFSKESTPEEQQRVEKFFLFIANQLKYIENTLRGILAEDGVLMHSGSNKQAIFFSQSCMDFLDRKPQI